jgi:dipeptidyl aminopeptidase/acylaminoacyl peptidase
LLDRGFVYAIAHIRGGQEMGRRWYEDGRQLSKIHTFTDFIAATEHLVKQKYASPDLVFAKGGSAGGLLMGAIINIRPELFKGVIANAVCRRGDHDARRHIRSLPGIWRVGHFQRKEVLRLHPSLLALPYPV